MRTNRFTSRLAFAFTLFGAVGIPLAAEATLTVTPITWNIVGLDSNNPAVGPHLFPVGARVCSNVATTNVAVNFVFDTANANINLRAGSLSGISLPSIGAGACADAYFEVDVTQVPAAFDTARRYHITATDGSGTASTPTPRELYVEHLISQNRNSVSDVKYGPVGGPYTSVPAGGSFSVVVGNTYDIQLFGGTATQGYNQFEEFINFPNTIFQILGVNTTYSADDSPFVPNPNNKLYADACLWQNDPNSPVYRSCTGGDFKAGGNSVVTTYTVKIISGGGTNQTLGSLLYDFSGSSYHYNSDFGFGARIANVIDPTSANISKSFSPSTTSINGVSVLSITLTNPNGGTLSGYNFVDNLPANLVVATPNGATTSGCGTPTLTATAGSSTISFSNGTVAANSNCIVNVNVTPTATGSLVNTTNHLFIGSVDTTHFATATLTSNSAPPPPPGLCGQTLALWDFPTGFNAASPAPTTANVAAGAAPGAGVIAIATAHDSTLHPAAGTVSWGSNGGIAGPGTTLDTTQNDYFEFAINTTGVSSVSLSFDAEFRAANGPKGVAVYYGTTNTRPESGTQLLNNATALSTQNTWSSFGPFNVNSGLNSSGNTYFRVYFFNAGNQNSGSDGEIDHVLFTGCVPAIQPTIAKAFAPNPIAVNSVSTLTFTLTNTNTVALTGAAFNDTLPSGVQVAATPAAATTCGGAWSPAAASTSLVFAAGTIPASGSCTVSVNVTATMAGPHGNVSGFVSTTEGGTNTNSIASASLSAVLPPSISKLFSSPIIPGGTSTLTFTFINPNQNDVLSGVAFGDTFPTSPGAMVVAATPNPVTNGCGSPTFTPAPGSGSITFSGGTIAAGGTCVVSVDVTAPATGTYNNTSGPVSYIINAQTVNGNTTSGSLVVNPPNPSIHLLKQVGPTNSGPWSPFLPISVGGNVFYQFTVENTGDVPLTSPQLTDNAVDVSTCNAAWSGLTLPVAVQANNNHIITCVVGPITAVSGAHTNTASVSATFNASPVTSPNSSATYATTALTLAKSVTETSFTLPGEILHYSYLVTNSGFAPLAGPVTVADDHAIVTCPAVSTVGDLDNFLDPGESVTCTATYTVTPGDVANAQVTNTAQATAAGVNSNSDSKMVPLSTSADVSMVKTLDTAGPYLTGQTVSYTLTVANGGPSTATSIQVTDTPTNLTITNVSGSGCSSLPCTIASLASGANTQIFVTATINVAGAFDNSATATAAQPDPNPSNNTDNSGNGGTAVDSADLAVVKTFVTQGPYRNGDVITFNIAVTNNGPSTATNVVVVDHPVGLTIQSMSGGNCNGAVINGNPNQNVQCTIASLANGATENVTVTAHIDNPGQFLNRGIVSADQNDPNTNDNSSDAVDVATTSADVSIVKSITTAGPYYVGETITYTLTVHNVGPSPASFVVVNDTPTNMTIQSVSGANCSSLPCTMSNPPVMVIGNTRVITVTATINASGAFSNTATANGNDFDPDASNNSSTAGDTTSPSADLSVLKTFVTQGPYRMGDVITFNIAVTNNGPDTANNVVVLDHPVGLTIQSMSGGGCTGAVINGNPNQNVQCTIASLANGATANVTVTAHIDNPGQFLNRATVSADEIDPNTNNNLSDAVDVATTSADVSIVKTLITAGPYYAGETITYTLTVHNAGPSPASFVVVSDTPTNLTIQSVSGANCSSLPCTMSNPPVMVIGNTRVITVTATINAAGAFDNSASANGNDFDPDTSNNTDSSGNGGTALSSADVSMVKTLTTAGPFTPGQSVTYTLVVANAGPSTATAIVVTDTPTNLTVTNVSGSGCAALPCTIASLASGANTTITVTATINAAGAFDNSATATAAEFDPNTANNTDSSGNGGTTGAPSADVSMVKTLTTSGPFTQGQTIGYTLLVANAGPSTATNIQVTDTPTNLTITNVSGGGCSALPCTIASLGNGASVTINVTATITAGGAFDNSATATATEADPNTANNTDSTGNGGTAASTSADVGITKTASPTTVAVGQTLDYTLVVVNHGPATATNVTVTDSLPANFSLISATPTQGSCSGTTNVTCSLGTLVNGATVTITLHGNVTATGSLANTAGVSAAESDSVTANNSSSFTPILVGDIPTLSEWALIVLGMMLALAGAVAVRRNG
jgi:uncharacterized repeat protein (TIGR01451 family)